MVRVRVRRVLGLRAWRTGSALWQGRVACVVAPVPHGAFLFFVLLKPILSSVSFFVERATRVSGCRRRRSQRSFFWLAVAERDRQKDLSDGPSRAAAARRHGRARQRKRSAQNRCMSRTCIFANLQPVSQVSQSFTNFSMTNPQHNLCTRIYRKQK